MRMRSEPHGSSVSEVSASSLSHDAQVEATLDGLAEHLEAHIDIDGLLKLAR